MACQSLSQNGALDVFLASKCNVNRFRPGVLPDTAGELTTLLQTPWSDGEGTPPSWEGTHPPISLPSRRLRRLDLDGYGALGPGVSLLNSFRCR